MYHAIFVYAVQALDTALIDVWMFICGNQSSIIKPAGCSLWHNCGFVLFWKGTLLQNGHNCWKPAIFHCLLPLFSLRSALHEEQKTSWIRRHCTTCWHHRADTNSLQQDVHSTMGTMSKCYSTTAPRKQLHFIHSSTPTNSFPCIPVIALPDTLPLLSPQTGTAKSFCSVLLSHLLSLQNKLIHADAFTSRRCTEKSHPGDFTTSLSQYRPLSPPLSECWQFFRLLCSSHDPTYLPWLVFTRLPSKTSYGWVLFVCFLHFTGANCNLNSPANLINLYVTTVNMKFHGIFLLSFFFFPRNDQTK